MTRPLVHGELVETADGWRVVTSIPDPFVPGCYRWRSGQRYTVPELVDPETDGKVRWRDADGRWHDGPPPPPEDPLAGFVIVKVGP